MKLITARFPGKCARCGGAIEQGAQIWFDPKAARGKTAIHSACGDSPAKAKPAPAPAPEPRRAVGKQSVAPAGYFEPTHMMFFDSAADLAADVTPSPANRAKHAEKMAGHPGNGGRGVESWYGFGSLRDGIAAFRGGWPEGANRLLETLESVDIALNLTSRRRKAIWSDQGDEVDMQRVWMGNLDRSFRKTRRLDRQSPGVITIVINHSIHWRLDSEQLFWAGAAALRLALDLEESGHSAEILVAFSAERATEDGQDSFGMVTTVKDAGAPLDLGAMAGVCCSGITMRHFCLTQMTAAAKPINTIFGVPSDALPVALQSRERVVVALASQIKGSAEAAQWVSDAADYVRMGAGQNAALAA